jgi:hypothetical protein
MGDADGVTQNSRLGVAVVIEVDAANELDQRATLGALMCPFGVYRLSDQVERHWIIPHLRYVKIPRLAPGRNNFPASEMRDNSALALWKSVGGETRAKNLNAGAQQNASHRKVRQAWRRNDNPVANLNRPTHNARSFRRYLPP